MIPDNSDNNLKRDPDLQALFAEEHSDNQDPKLTASIMGKINNERRKTKQTKILFGLVGIGLLVIFQGPLMSFGLLISNGLSTPIMAVGDGALDPFMSPFNSYAFPAAMVFLGINKIRKMIFR